MGWWPGVFKDDAQIDIEHAHVKSDNVKLSDLPWEEQAFFERNLYDQRMEKLGQPTSSEKLRAEGKPMMN